MDLNTHYRNRVMEMAKWGAGIAISELTVDEVQRLRSQLEVKFETPFLWSLDFSGDTSVYNADAWRWTHEFLTRKKTILLVRVGREIIGFEFADGKTALQAVENLKIYSDFYFTNVEATFLFYQHHEETLVAVGEAADWLEEKINAIYGLLELAPKPLAVKDMQIREWGQEVMLECFYDPAGENKIIRLIFKKLWIKDLHARGSEHQQNPEVHHIVFIQPTYERGSQSVSILTKAFHLHFAYGDLIVEHVVK